MRSVSAVAVLSGPIVLMGYLVGAVTGTWLDGDERPSDRLLEAFATLASSTAAWWTVQELSPGSNLSRIGYLSNQVLSAWQSVAIWTGLAVVAGICAPVFRRFRGSDGLAPAAAVLGAHFPVFLVVAAGAGATVFAVARSPRMAHLAAIAAMLPISWLAWVLEWQPAWGLTPGPEAAVWTMVLTIVLGVRWWSDRSPD